MTLGARIPNVTRMEKNMNRKNALQMRKKKHDEIIQNENVNSNTNVFINVHPNSEVK